jgi:ABC-type polar amino acid transport system ATPase subunit
MSMASSTSTETGSAPSSDDIVVLKDIRKSYGAAEVLKGIDLVAKRGETTVIIGGSGAGKTTLLRLIVALEQPTSGELRIDGENIVGKGERALNQVRRPVHIIARSWRAELRSSTVTVHGPQTAIT